MSKKDNFDQSILADFSYGLSSNGFASNEFGTSKKDNVTINYFWIFSGQTPSPTVRGRWTDVNIWGTTETWLG